MYIDSWERFSDVSEELFSNHPERVCISSQFIRKHGMVVEVVLHSPLHP